MRKARLQDTVHRYFFRRSNGPAERDYFYHWYRSEERIIFFETFRFLRILHQGNGEEQSDNRFAFEPLVERPYNSFGFPLKIIRLPSQTKANSSFRSGAG